MAKRLKCYIFESKTLSSPAESFGPLSGPLPEWLLERIADQPHLFEERDEDENSVRLPAPKDDLGKGEYPTTGASQSQEPAATELGQTELEPVVEEDGQSDGDDDENVAPKRNASELEWREFAEEEGVPVTAEMKREDIINACEEAGVIQPKA